MKPKTKITLSILAYILAIPISFFLGMMGTSKELTDYSAAFLLFGLSFSIAFNFAPPLSLIIMLVNGMKLSEIKKDLKDTWKDACKYDKIQNPLNVMK